MGTPSAATPLSRDTATAAPNNHTVRCGARCAFFGVALAAIATGQEPPVTGLETLQHFRFELRQERLGELPSLVGGCVAIFDAQRSELALRCRHTARGGVETALRLERLEGAEREVVKSLGSAESPIDVKIALTRAESAELVAGRLVISFASASVASNSASSLVLGALGEPTFVSGFESIGLCDWSAFDTACDDGNVCTDAILDDTCDPLSLGCSITFNSEPCALPDATGVCDGGGCTVDSCNLGHSNCDGTDANGCEFDHEVVTATCATGTNVGTYGGDTLCASGFTCPANLTWDLFATQTGLNSRWFKARAFEDSSCDAYLEHRIRLDPPAGVDYDLHVYRTCGGSAQSSENGTGLDDVVVVTDDDDFGSDDSFDYFVFVEYVSGSSCAPWTLTFEGHNC